jgi:protocatechuate 3,4-dioxygenase beta subunit
MKYLIFIFLSLLFNFSSSASEITHCNPTKNTINNYEPEVFNNTNNLLRASGAKALYCGIKTIIFGRVLDKACVPVSDAKVYMWQMGCDGKYPYKTFRTGVDKNLLNPINGSSFQGNGIATTNNMGQFFFITVVPPKINGKSTVYFKVEHIRIGNLQTEFEVSEANLITSELDLPNQLKPFIDLPIYAVDIIMPTKDLKRY